MTMPLTADYREGIREEIKRDPVFRRGMLSEALEVLLGGEVTIAKEILRDYINATITFPKLAAGTKIHVKTLHQMFGPNGNPTANNLFEIISYLQRAEGVRFEVRSVPVRAHSKGRASARRTKRAA
ncbi:MAG: transcriptional regulator [Candidatus Acidiferrales bacterium]